MDFFPDFGVISSTTISFIKVFAFLYRKLSWDLDIDNLNPNLFAS